MDRSFRFEHFVPVYQWRWIIIHPVEYLSHCLVVNRSETNKTQQCNFPQHRAGNSAENAWRDVETPPISNNSENANFAIHENRAFDIYLIKQSHYSLRPEPLWGEGIVRPHASAPVAGFINDLQQLDGESTSKIPNISAYQVMWWNISPRYRGFRLYFLC